MWKQKTALSEKKNCYQEIAKLAKQFAKHNKNNYFLYRLGKNQLFKNVFVVYSAFQSHCTSVYVLEVCLSVEDSWCICFFRFLLQDKNSDTQQKK